MDRIRDFLATEMMVPAFEAQDLKATNTDPKTKLSFRGTVSAALKSFIQRIKNFFTKKDVEDKNEEAMEGFFSKKELSNPVDVLREVQKAIRNDYDMLMKKAETEKGSTFIVMSDGGNGNVVNWAIGIKEQLWEQNIQFFLYNFSGNGKTVTVGIVTNGQLGNKGKTIYAGAVYMDVNPAGILKDPKGVNHYVKEHGGKSVIDITLYMLPYYEAGVPYTGNLINKVVILWNGKLEITYND